MTLLLPGFKRLSIHAIKNKKKKEVPFLNILMTELRPASVQQKLQSFYSIIDHFLKNNKSVNIVVILGKVEHKKIEDVYSKCLAEFLKMESFNILFIKPLVSWNLKLLAFTYMTRYLANLNGSFAQRFNFACLSTLIRLRMVFFQEVYKLITCENWLGLTGGVELPTFMFKKNKLRKNNTVNALQFGQASKDQFHFSKYSVDNFFVYDLYSSKIFKSLDMKVKNIVVTGSPEFEYQSRLICNKKLLDEDKLSIVFIDQPVLQRGEYTKKSLLNFHTMLCSLNNDPDIKVNVKLHPRGSAFDREAWSDFTVVDDLGDSLSRAHVVIGFFSNLCDLALVQNRITFYVGCNEILSKEKRDWITSLGGNIVDNVEFFLQEVLSLKGQYLTIANKIICSNISLANPPSVLIYKRMVECYDTKTIPRVVKKL